ncbi:MAG TPA: TlpA disulfide reductase family protein [Anaeromyxobacter sp.]|nr:TlpA disulfide reductase family protein [Anaeromyxobacter sp.]
MRSERRARAVLGLLAAAAVAAGCRARPAEGDAGAVERFQGVRRQAAPPAAAQSAFCERSYPAGGDGARRWAAPPLRPLPGAQDGAAGAGAWTWVNLWATWCTPCVEEMELLGRWREGFSREGLAVSLELLSVDDADAEKALVAARAKGLPGAVRWLRSPDDLPPLLDALGVDRSAAIPIHALVDPAGWLRCVRVGAIHEQDWAAAKALVAR